MEIGGGRIIGKESSGGAAPTEFAMYNADQYMKPEGAFTLETAKDGSKWYKQVPEDTVQKTPYMDGNNEIQYKEELVQKLPQIPRRAAMSSQSGTVRFPPPCLQTMSL